MATLVLSIAGGALLGPVGKLAGGIVGSLLDQQIFGRFSDPTEGPRLDSLRAPSFDEGSPAAYCLGPENRVPGQVIWVSDMREVKTTTGGKGGSGGAKTTYYDYYVDIAVAFARQTLTSSKPVVKIWANSEKIYEANIGINRSSNKVSVSTTTEKKNFVTGCTQKAFNEYITYSHYDATGAVPNFFMKVRTGALITVSGFANAANNGTFMVDQVIGLGSASSIRVFKCAHDWTYKYVNPAFGVGGGSFFGSAQGQYTCVDGSSCAPGVAAAAGPTVTFVQDSLDEFNKATFESITQYNGSLSQSADSLMATALGSGKCPAHRGTVYVVIKGLKVTKWGGTIPSFEGLVSEASSRTVGDAINALLRRNSKITSNDIDTSAISGDLFGLTVMGPQSSLDMIRSLMAVHDIEVQARGVIEGGVFRNKLVFFNKENAEERSVADGDRGAAASGTAESTIMTVKNVDPTTLPVEVVVTFIDRDNDYQQGSRSYRRQTSPVENSTRISLPMSLSESNVAAFAKKMAWMTYINSRLSIELDLPLTYLDVVESDILVVNDLDGLEIKARVTKVDRGANGLLKFEAASELVNVYSEPTTGEDPPG